MKTSLSLSLSLSLSRPGAVARALSSAALVASLVWASPVSAQVPAFRPAALKEAYLTSNTTKQVQNTGCGQSSDGSKVLQVMTWDGVTPSFGWSFTGSMSGFQPLEATRKGIKVSDPDIVSYYDTNSKTYYLAAVYLNYSAVGATQIYYEVQKYSPSANAWGVVVAPAPVSTGTNDCTNPNIDVDRVGGDAVIVYQQGGGLYARALALSGAGLSTSVQNVAISNGALSYSQPDVAVYEELNGGLPVKVSVTFITLNTSLGTKEVSLTQDDFATVQTGGGSFPAPAAPTSPLFGPVSSTQLLELPRIAAPMFSTSNVNPLDCMTLVRYNNNAGSGDRILSLTIQGGSVAPTQTVNAPLTANLQGNSRPVVTYIGDGALVAWQFAKNPGTPNPDLDVLGIWVNLNGKPSTTFTGDLLVANRNTGGNQFIPSLEARGGAQSIGSDGVAIWFDEAVADIAYKPIHWFTGNLRPANASAETMGQSAPASERQLTVYPNPAATGAQVMVRLATGETAQLLQVLEPRTGSVVATLPLSKLQAGVNELVLPVLPAGLYMLRLQTDQGPRLTRFSYQP